jgi:peptidoglycan/xylan/chitin deacetylase (PgdA/CDA1 family)
MGGLDGRCGWSMTRTLALVALATAAAVSTADGRALERRVAVTFDDLPGTALTPGQRCSSDALREVSEHLLAPFRRHGWPLTGFVTESRLCGELSQADLIGILDLWLASGAELGNHTFSHLDLNDLAVEEFTADVVRGERTLRPVLERAGRPLRYFRHPYLHAGDTQEKSTRVGAWLASRGYEVGVVTMDNQEWIYSAVYARARERGDEALMREVVTGYLRHLSESIEYYEDLSLRRFGRNIPQVLLLHANALNADAIESVVSLLRDRGYRFEALESVLEDEAYASPDLYVGPTGLSWLHRWFDDGPAESASEPRESLRMRELFESYGR